MQVYAAEIDAKLGSPEGTPPTPNPWANGADAKALLAEATALIESGAKEPK